MPLPDGTIAAGTVNLIRHDTGGWLHVAGELHGPVAGTFALSTDGAKTSGLLQFPARQLAWELIEDAARGPILRQRPLGEILCLPLPRPNFEPATPPARTRASSQAPPLLGSRPEATAVLYLDFDGETVTDPLWNGGRTINAKPPNLTNTDITNIWRRVKEDFWPFNVDVTTDLARYTSAPVGRRMRCIITPTDTAARGAGGVAYVGSFAEAGTANFSSDIPCWVFNYSVNGIAEAVSHELGHTLGLHHDGRTSPAEEYYAGQGSGPTGWAPIMGVGYYKALVQWSKGEYLNANRTEDDLAIISGDANGFGYVADEAGDTIATAPALAVAGSEVNQTGIITAAGDVDVFAFTTGGGPVDIVANPAPLSPNLDILLELLDATGSVLAASNPPASLPASIAATLPPGVHYLRIRGTGAGNALTTGYTAYASIGEYAITGVIPPGSAAPTITSAGSADGEVGVPFAYQIAATGSPDSYGVVGTLPGGLTLDPLTGLISGTPAESTTRSLTLQAANQHGTGSKPFTITIHAAGSPAITSARTARGALGLGFGHQIATTHPADSFSLDGVLPAGLSLDPATGLLSGVPSESGSFTVVLTASNANGSGSADLSIEITGASIALDQALDIPGRSFADSGTAPWQGQPAITFDGADAAQSAPVGDNGVSAMSTTVAGSVTVSFRYRVDGEADHDALIFMVDEVPQLTASGFVDWTEFAIALDAGDHLLRWEYRKDAAGRAGADAAWIDTLRITSASAPVITSAGFAQGRVDVPFSHSITATNNPTSFGFAGTLPAGLAFDAATGIISGTPLEGGVFTATIAATNAGGTGTREFVLSVDASVFDLTGALDQENLAWTNTGPALWRGEADVTHDSVDAAAATGVGDGQQATMETNIEGPASLRFFWRVSSERDYDHLSFSIDGEERNRISGEVDWQLQSYPIPAGSHRIAFTYRRDLAGSAGANAAWVDEVSVFPREGLAGSDSFAGAQALTGTHVALATNNLAATLEPGEVGPLGSSYGHSLWWSWTAPATGRVTATTAGSSFDTILAIYTGTSLFDLATIAVDDDLSRRDKTSRVGFHAVAGQTYFLSIGGFGDASGFINFALHYAGRGTYLGIIAPDDGADRLAGNIGLTLTETLAYTARLVFEGRRYRWRGSLIAGDDFQEIGPVPLVLTLRTDLANGESSLAGTLRAGGQGYRFAARRRIGAADLSNLAEGACTVVLEPATSGTAVAYGAGYGRAVISRRGDIRFSGFLGDGQPASHGSALTFGSIWPCFLAPHRQGRGTMAGEVAFDPVAANNFTGDLRWRVENPATGTFSDDVELTGSYYFRPTADFPALSVNAGANNVQLVFSHRDAAADPIDPFVTLDSSSRFIGIPAGVALKLNPRTGIFRGWLLVPPAGTRQRFSGALIQSPLEDRGAGLFKASTGHGRVDLLPVP